MKVKIVSCYYTNTHVWYHDLIGFEFDVESVRNNRSSYRLKGEPQLWIGKEDCVKVRKKKI